VTSVDRTAYPVFPKLVLARDLHVFFTPSPDEAVWAREKTDTDEHLLALALALKCFQKMGRFPRDAEVPESVVEHVRRCLELGDQALPVYVSARRGGRRPAAGRLGPDDEAVAGDRLGGDGQFEQPVEEHAATA
jgi:Domain of unknown function (DUF4158)